MRVEHFKSYRARSTTYPWRSFLELPAGDIILRILARTTAAEQIFRGIDAYGRCVIVKEFLFMGQARILHKFFTNRVIMLENSPLSYKWLQICNHSHDLITTCQVKREDFINNLEYEKSCQEQLQECYSDLCWWPHIPKTVTTCLTTIPSTIFLLHHVSEISDSHNSKITWYQYLTGLLSFCFYCFCTH